MSDPKPRTIEVRLTQQQLVFLEQVRAEGIFGETMEEVLVAIFREQMKTTNSRARNQA